MAEDDESFWTLNLEAALLETCNASIVYNICKGRAFPDHIRPEAWEVCLGVRDTENKLLNFDEIYDLPQQHQLRTDCQNFVDKLGNDECDKLSVLSDLESLLTYYSKTKCLDYSNTNNWIEILLPILALKRPRYETYNIFEAVIRLYIPANKNCTNVYHLLRLLILYHDPELCSFLDTKRITPDMFCVQWFQSLFSASCHLKVVQFMWDLYFQQADPFFVFYLSLVIILNGKEVIMSMKNETKCKIIETMSVMPSGLDSEDVRDLCTLAQYYALKTPSCFKKDLYLLLYGEEENYNVEDVNPSKPPLSQALCLPVTADELVENAADNLEPALEGGLQRVRFFLVDCRPAEQYNAGHLPTAFHLNCNLMLQEPASFSTAVQGLLSFQKQSIAANSNAAGEHLCFLGSGRAEEDQYCHMVVASFLQKHIRYVSMLSGGYQAIHDYFGSDMSDCLEDHNRRQCLACNLDENTGTSSPTDPSATNTTTAPTKSLSDSGDLLGKISAVVKNKSADLTGKLFDYIINPTMNNSVSDTRHVSSRDRVGRLYRNLQPVFSIDNDHDQDFDVDIEDPDEAHTEQDKIVTLSDYVTSPNTVATFPCYEIRVKGYMYESLLIVTDSLLLVLRELKARKGLAKVSVRRYLDTIVKITSKKKHPEIITFKYGNVDSDTLAISDMDRLFIPDASKATELIAKQILLFSKKKETDQDSQDAYK